MKLIVYILDDRKDIHCSIGACIVAGVGADTWPSVIVIVIVIAIADVATGMRGRMMINRLKKKKR